jgi:hypothetical protein
MNILRRILNLRNLFVLGVIVCVVLVFRSWSAGAEVNRERLWSVPIIVSPSVQLVNGQVLLFKATNISTTPVGMRLTLYNERDRGPVVVEEFPRVAPGGTVTYLYNSPPGKGKLEINETTIEVPDAMRAVLDPMPGGEPGAIGRVVANLQILRLQTTPANASAPSLEAPSIVPLERCLFSPTGYLPHYTDGLFYYNCAPELFDGLHRQLVVDLDRNAQISANASRQPRAR